MAVRIRYLLVVAMLCTALGAGAARAEAQVPNLLNYQGHLTDSAGSPQNGTYSMQFAVYDALTGGNQLPSGSPWSETQSVTVTGGVFNVLLGSVTALPSNLFLGGPSDASGPLRFLEVIVNGETLSPRKRIVSAAYALGGAGSQADFGDGSDGDVTISANTTLQRDMFYSNLTINSGVSLSTAGFRVFVRGQLTNNGSILNDGDNGAVGNAGTLPLGATSQSGGFAGAAGTVGSAGGPGGNAVLVGVSLGSAGVLGGSGGAGGIGPSNPGGAGGAAGSVGSFVAAKSVPRTTTSAYLLADIGVGGLVQQSGSQAGSGGGGGGGGGGGSTGGPGGVGGSSGYSGGTMALYARLLVNNGTIRARGGNGVNGAVGANAISGNTGGGGGGGGGAGGAGGVIIVVYQSLTNSGTISAPGGIGGVGGSGGNGLGTGGHGHPGLNGANGNAGVVWMLQL